MKLRSEHASEEARIEIIPLIDVIFCILTFFILAALGLTRQSTIGLDLPRASTGSTEMRNMLIVSIDPIGQTYIERTPVTRDQLLDAMFDFQATDPTGTVVLYASRSASYNDVVEVLDLLRSVGGDRVGLATLPDSGADMELTDPSAIPTDVPAPGFDLNSDPFQLPGAPGDLPPTDSGTVPGDDLVFPDFNAQPTPRQNGTN
ncbi:MAG: biopolymer transporter ExbD [Synechococcales cyanobacterium T60_A2020_003]|nr:biopolymer transporter ExbD [Synechococcales cyanobacterium T60_A2020_003]